MKEEYTSLEYDDGHEAEYDDYEPEERLCPCECGCRERVMYYGQKCPMCAEACFCGSYFD